MQYPNWLLHCLIFQEGTPLHVEPGNTFRRKAGTKLENKNEELAASLEYVEVLREDEDGNVIVKKVY